MPVGYWWTVALVSWGVACALTRWRRLGSFSAIPALLVSELPFIVGYLLIASTVLALVDGDLGSPGGAAGAAVALLAWPAWWSWCAARCARTRRCATPGGRGGRGAASCAPRSSPAGRRGRVRGLAYGGGPRRTLDVYHRRDRPASAPVLLHFHGGGFYSGNKAREARPLIRHLTSRRGFVCVSANYRLQPHVTLADQVADVRSAIAWVRAHAAEYRRRARHTVPRRQFGRGEPGDPGGVRGRDRHRGPDLPLRLLRRPRAARRHAAHARGARREGHDGYLRRTCAPSWSGYAQCRATRSATPSCPVRTTTSTCYESIRSAAVSTAVEQFTARVSASRGANHQDRQPAPDS